MKIVEREKARELRKLGYSINQIVRVTGFSKGSVSVWVRDIELTEAQRQKLSEHGRSVESVERRRRSRLANEHVKSRAVMDSAKHDIETLSLHELKIIGSMLYLGEGAKTKKGLVRVANSDPKTIRIILAFFRKVCLVPEHKLYGHIHTFENADVEMTERYWAELTGIPRTQFHKTYVKQSIASLHKRKTLPYGTLDVGVNDTKLFLRIMGWIEKIQELVLGEK